MAKIEERLADEESLRLECVRLSVAMVQAPNVRGDSDAVIGAAAAIEKFIKSEKK